ncbi:MAG: hypothetical protein QNJ68_10380 [Microcoleaceae cyanobacterium MO_207.B10]|nr:hypothetical protein [Microcoleaceae cyanobacterium MO_207.B10]
MSAVFKNEYLQLISLIIGTLGTVATASLPLIISQTSSQMKRYKAKAEKLKDAEGVLGEYIKTAESLITLCQSVRESSEIFNPETDRAKIISYYQHTIYQIEERLIDISEDGRFNNRFLRDNKEKR